MGIDVSTTSGATAESAIGVAADASWPPGVAGGSSAWGARLARAVVGSAAAMVSARPQALPKKTDSSPTLSVTSPTISITLPATLRPPKLEKPKNILYGEASRKFRRTVYSHDDWERHRSPDRFIRNLASITTSGVYKVGPCV